MYAPVVIFGFNRPDTMQRVLDSLSRCEGLTGQGERRGYAFIDGRRTERDAEGIGRTLKAVTEFRDRHFPRLEICVRDVNFGCRRNIVTGLTDVLERHGRAIVIEDDVLVSRTFLSYQDAALDRYESDKRIWCVNGWRDRTVRVPPHYGHDVYLSPRNMSWGWGTWKDRWERVDFELKGWPEFRSRECDMERLCAAGRDLPAMLDAQFEGRLRTWDVQCSYHMVRHGLFAVEPRLALTKNIGSGTECMHCGKADVAVLTARYYDFRPQLPDGLSADAEICGQFRDRGQRDPLRLHRLWQKMLLNWWRFGPRHDTPITCS